MFNQNNNSENFRFDSYADDEPDLIPLLSAEDEEQINAEQIPEVLSILPLRNTVLFPVVVIPITVGRDKSVKLIKDSYKAAKVIGVVSQKDIGIEDPSFEDLNKTGTVAHILKMLQMPDGNTTVIIQGKKRFRLVELVQNDPYVKAKIEPFQDVKAFVKDKEFTALVDSLKDISLQNIRQSPQIPSEAGFAKKNIESPSFLVNFISSNMNVEVEIKQQLLEITDLKQRANKTFTSRIND